MLQTKVFCAKILFHKEGAQKYIENRPNFVACEGINRSLAVWREYLLGGFRMYKL